MSSSWIHTLSHTHTHTHLDGGRGHAEVELVLVLDTHLDQLLYAHFVLRQKENYISVKNNPLLVDGFMGVHGQGGTPIGHQRDQRVL